MAANVTIIGRGARVRGRIVASNGSSDSRGDLEILGFVEGEVAVGGDVTIDSTGIVGANVSGRKIVVRGAVKGDLTGDEAVLLEEGARVAGDVKAPRVAIAPGALVRGYVQTGHGGATATRPAARTQAAAPVRHAAPVSPPAKAAAPAPAAPKASPAAAPAIRLAGGRTEAAASSGSGARRPPPPIVPVLKKAKGQLATKKKER